MNRLLRAAAVFGATTMALAGAATPAVAMPTLERQSYCFDAESVVGAAAGARGAGDGARGLDHRDISLREQHAIAEQTRLALARKGTTPAEAAADFSGATIPVYVHVMRDKAGNGDVTDSQISQQITVLNRTFGGQESSSAADTGFTFTLAGTYRYNNDQWHKDRKSTQYRSQTRKGGADALNIWLVDFSYLGIATFPWDYSKQPGIDGIRVHYDSLPGGSIANYNLGETATHEAGHWVGLYHTFQGGCTSTNDEVSDTPAQSSSTNGCPEGRDSCSLPGLDPIHNYMDYSYDSCYTEFTGGQAARSASMWTAYRL
ncbi:MAG: zinc metalloprotease [Nocardioidaceae bacterium]